MSLSGSSLSLSYGYSLGLMGMDMNIGSHTSVTVSHHTPYTSHTAQQTEITKIFIQASYYSQPIALQILCLLTGTTAHLADPVTA